MKRMKKAGALLSYAMRRRGMSVNYMSKATGIRPETIRRYLAGDVPSRISAKKIACQIAAHAPQPLRAWGYDDLADQCETGWKAMVKVAQEYDCLREGVRRWSENVRIEYPYPPLTDEQLEAVYDVIAQFQANLASEEREPPRA